MLDLALLVIALVALLIACYTDLKTTEIPDYLNFYLIAVGVMIRLGALFLGYEASFFWDGLLAFGLFVLIACSMYYTGQWGGGDAKLLMALGILLGTYPVTLLPLLATWGFTPTLEWYFPLVLLINFFLCGAIWSFAWLFVLAVKNLKAFLHELVRLNMRIKRKRQVFLLTVLALVLLSFVVDDWYAILVLATLSFVMLVSGLLWMFTKVVERACMIKTIPVSKLTEGDWLMENVKVRGRTICSAKDLGVEKEQIALLKKHHVRNVVVKYGIPFAPAFLLGALVTILYGNLIFL